MTARCVLLLLLLELLPLQCLPIEQDINSGIRQLRVDRDQLRRKQTLLPPSESAGAPAQDANLQARIDQLETVIGKGEAASVELRKQIAGLESETRKLHDEKQQLLTVQTALTSGLIGALIAAAAAIVGATSNIRKFRVDRDHRRLEVIEKALLLGGKGIVLPSDIVTRYMNGVQPMPGTGTEAGAIARAQDSGF